MTREFTTGSAFRHAIYSRLVPMANVQQLPKDESTVVPDKDHQMMEVDLSGLEARARLAAKPDPS